MKKIAAAFLTAAIGIAAAEAAAQVHFKAPMEFAGTGCPPGSYAFSGDGTDTLSILFSTYDAANPPENAVSKMQRAACSFAVPVSVPSGYQVSVLTADWRGYAAGSTELFREYFVAGQPGISKTSNPSGNYAERDDDLQYATSSCGEDVTLRINSAASAMDSGSYLAVDSVDLHNAVVFHLQWEACGPLALPAALKLLLLH